MSKPEVTMFIAMNRFKIKPGCEQDFIEIWKGRDSFLETVPGFKEFHLLQGQSNDEFTLFSSHAVWESKEAFEAWTKSEAFRKAHANAGSRKDIYAGPPQLECFESVL
jgi:heme-degrading monooxygenase HmoA